MDLYPFSYNYKFPIGKDEVSFDNLDPSKYGIEILWPTKDLKVKVYAIIYYGDGSSKELYTEAYIEKDVSAEFDGTLIEDAFKISQNMNGDGIPKYIELIFTPFKCYPFKWMISII
jgi:hypothetical protein